MESRQGTAREMPWGWWLRSERGFLVDDKGRRWRSVREAYWQGHLGFPETQVVLDEQSELLLRVLTSMACRLVGEREGRHDLFDGDMMAWRFYMCWLVSIGLAQKPGGGSFSFEAPLTDEGRAVMLMLQATRNGAWVDLPMREVVEAVRTAGRGVAEAARERELKAFEAEAVHLPWVFERRRIRASFMITLTGMSLEGRMPIRRVVWSQAFTDETMRDDFFAWLAERVERWEDWGKFTYSRGADALTQRFLAQVGVSPSGAA